MIEKNASSYVVEFGGNGSPTIPFRCPICNDRRVRMEGEHTSPVAGIHSGGLRAELRFACACGRKFALTFLTHNDFGVATWRRLPDCEANHA